MSITIVCDECGRTFHAASRLAGRKVRCKCGCIMRVPADGASAASPSHTRGPAEPQAPASNVEAPPSTGQPPPAPRLRAVSRKVVHLCPACHDEIEEGTVVCPSCGTDRRTGKKVEQPVGPQRGAGAAVAARASSAGEPRVAAPHAAPVVRSGGVGRGVWMARTAAVVAVAGMAAWGSWRLVRRVTHDPEAEVAARLARLSAGMSVEQVVDTAGPPQEAYVFVDPRQAGGIVGAGGAAKVGYVNGFMKAHGSEKLARGFFFCYRFGAAGEQRVYFTPDGTLSRIEAARGPRR